MRANDRHVDKFCGPVPDSPSLIGMLRPALALGSLVVTVALLTACASEPEPEWTEEEAYAAAEETFRAYWGASAFSGAESDPRPYLTGEMLEMYSDWSPKSEDYVIEIQGSAEIVDFKASDYVIVGDAVALDASACIDASTLKVKNDEGEWIRPRDDVRYAVVMSFHTVEGQMLIDEFDEGEATGCAP